MRQQPTNKQASSFSGDLFVRVNGGLKNALSKLQENQIDGEFKELTTLNEASFLVVRDRHLEKRTSPIQNVSSGIVFLLSLIGAPISVISWFVSGDEAYLFGAVFWLVVGCLFYVYLARSAKYWREHNAIRTEETRRFGRASFG
jgi:hypothetical protein